MGSGEEGPRRQGTASTESQRGQARVPHTGHVLGLKHKSEKGKQDQLIQSPGGCVKWFRFYPEEKLGATETFSIGNRGSQIGI